MRKDTNANYSSPGPTSTLPEGKGASAPDSAGVAFGLSSISGFDAEKAKDASLSMSSSTPGFDRQVKNPVSSKSVSSKGKTFEIKGCM